MANARGHPSDNAAASHLIRIRGSSELESFRVDGSIDVRGKVAPKAKRFAISLGLNPSNLWICFKPDLTKGIIICSYKKEGKWGREMTGRSCPFREGEEVERGIPSYTRRITQGKHVKRVAMLAWKIPFQFEATDSGAIVTVGLPDGTHFRFNSPVNVGLINFVAVDGDFQHYPDRSS